MSRAKSALLGSVSSQVFMIFGMFLSIAVTPLILQYLNKEEYGLYTTLFQIIGYLSIFDFGLGAAIARSLAAHRADNLESKIAINKIISTSFFTYFAVGALITFGGMALAPYFGSVFQMSPDLHDLSNSLALTLAIFIGMQFPIKVFSSILYAHQKQLIYNTTNFIVNFFTIALPVVFLYFGFGLWSFVYTTLVTFFISLIMTVYLMLRHYPFLRIRFKNFDKTFLKQMFSFGFFIFLTGIAGQIIFFSDRLFIGSIVSLSAVTLYSITIKAPELCRELAFRIADQAYPAMVEIGHQEGETRLKMMHQKLMILTICFVSIAFWMILIINEWFIKLWVGENFFAGYPVLLLSLAHMLLQSMIHVSFIFLMGAGKIKGYSMIAMFEAGLKIFLTVWLGKMFGITGIMFSTVLAAVLTGGWFVIFTTSRYLKIGFFEYFLKPVIIPFLLISGVGLLLYFSSKNLFQVIQLNWINFLVVSTILGCLFVIPTWFILLKKEFSNYLPDFLKTHRLLQLVK